MSKEEIITLIIQELEKVDDIDEKLDLLADLAVNYKDHPEYDSIMSEIYYSLKYDNNNEENPLLEEFSNVLESTNELIMNEKYDEVIDKLFPYQGLVDELLDVSDVDLDKLEVCCFFNEIEKQMFYYRCSDPNKDIQLINPLASEYYSRLALVYHNSSNFNKAIECYKKILAFNPCSNQALLGMAHIAYIQDNYLTALEYLKEFAIYAFSSELIFEAYQLLTNIYIQYAKYDYAALFAYIGTSFAPSEELEETMMKVYMQYKSEIKFDIDNDEELDNHLLVEEFKYMPNDDVMDVLYTMLLDYKGKEGLEEEYFDMSQIILSLVDDEELEKDIESLFREYN